MRATRKLSAGACALTLTACASAAPSIEAPGPVSAPAISPDVQEWSDPSFTEGFLSDPGPAVADPILSSPTLRDPDVLGDVERWMRFWTTDGSRWFPEYLARMAWFSPMVDSALAARGLPPSLRYLPVIESGYSPRAVSRARAVGLWQFMPSTARGFGLEVGPLVDERRNPMKSTLAAVSFLERLHERFQSWYLALAAYNSGPYRVERVLREHAPLAPRSDSLYWALREHFPRETRDFVPKFLGAAFVASQPHPHGLDPLPPVVGFHFDSVSVPDATTLDVVAEAAEVPQAVVERLNPEIVRGVTPPGREQPLRVPVGSGPRFTENYAKLPPEDRISYVEHRVARGETFSHIAVRYGVSLADLRAANPRARPRRLQIGQPLIVPVAPRSRASGGAG